MKLIQLMTIWLTCSTKPTRRYNSFGSAAFRLIPFGNSVSQLLLPDDANKLDRRFLYTQTTALTALESTLYRAADGDATPLLFLAI